MTFDFYLNLQEQSEFPEIESIRKTNALLKEYYSYIEEICPEAVVIRPADDPLYFTDKYFEYGAIPSHLNEIVDQKIAEKLESML